MDGERLCLDQRRTDWLAKEGIRVLRFSVEELEMRQAVVLATIAQAAPASTA
jgi:very-short-patch-repair endonuclease